MTKILVTGGAGYIGSHMVLTLLEAGYQPIVVDDLSTGSKALLPAQVPLHVFNLGDSARLDALLQSQPVDLIMHFAASIEVGESVQQPEKYYANNFVNTLTLLKAMKKHGIPHLIFSSSAAIFGEPQQVPVDETHPKHPINPYGLSKYMCEQLLHDFDRAHGTKSVSLRYFNAAGADPLCRTGYPVHRKASHLIPLVLQAVLHQRVPLAVYGRDYDTLDGTCVRDYIHVTDLCAAHLLAMQHLMAGGESRQYNLGNRQGYSVQQVIDVSEQVTGQTIKVVEASRRAGDPAKLIADASLIQQELGWQPAFPQLETIIQHAWEWEKKMAHVPSCSIP